MSDYEAGLLVRNAELLFVLEPLLREAKENRNDKEIEFVEEVYFDGLIKGYETAIALIKGEQK